MSFKISKEVEQLSNKRDLMELNGLDTREINRELLKKGLKEIFDCNDPEVKKEFEEADQRTIESVMRFDKVVGTNVFPLERAKRACDYILASLDIIDKSKNLDVIDLHIGYIEYAVVAIGSSVNKLTNRFENGYKSPFEKHGIREISHIKEAPPINKVKVLKKESKIMRTVTCAMIVALKGANKEKQYYAVCDLYAQSSELTYYMCLKDKKTLR